MAWILIGIIGLTALAADWYWNLRKPSGWAWDRRRCCCFEYMGDNPKCPVKEHHIRA